ncbi:thioredoxin domain-containing protein [Alteromonas macleodii]|uniref:hypothetical protein n=1 Tax=Alteromonas macleodii TaxID=28108 RepID=UPI00314035F6
MKRFVLTTIAAISLSCSAYANQVAAPTSPEDVEQTLNKVVPLPANKLFFAEDGESTYIFSQSGRFVFTGKVYDTWQKKYIENKADALNSHTVRLEEIGFPPELLGAIHTKQKGQVDAIVITDPNCSACKAIYDDIEDALPDSRVAYVLTNLVGGEDSVDAITEMYCATSDEDAVEKLKGDDDIELVYDNDCDETRLLKNIQLATLLDVQRLPVVINSVGRIQQGVPADLEAFLGEGRE